MIMKSVFITTFLKKLLLKIIKLGRVRQNTYRSFLVCIAEIGYIPRDRSMAIKKPL